MCVPWAGASVSVPDLRVGVVGLAVSAREDVAVDLLEVGQGVLEVPGVGDARLVLAVDVLEVVDRRRHVQPVLEPHLRIRIWANT